jgi:ribosomal protein L23
MCVERCARQTEGNSKTLITPQVMIMIMMTIYIYSATHETRTLSVDRSSNREEIILAVEKAFPGVKVTNVRLAVWSRYVDVEG